MIARTIETLGVTLDLFPRCAKCGEILDPNRLTLLVQIAERPNRLAHRDCPKVAA